MNQVILASALGAIIFVALGILINPWVGIAAGISVAYLAHDFRSETLTQIGRLGTSIGECKTQLLARGSSHWVQLLGPLRLLLLTGYRALMVMLAIIPIALHAPYIFFAEVWLGCDLNRSRYFKLFGLLMAATPSEREMSDPARPEDWALLLGIPLLVSGCLLFGVGLLLAIAWLVVQIYARERLLSTISATLGGWAGLYYQAAHNSPILSLAVGAVVGGALGGVQYRLLTLPLQRRFAR